MKQLLKLFIIFSMILCSGCTNNNETISPSQDEKEYIFINKEGMTLETRINVPKGYQRVETNKNSLTSFLRNYPLKEDGEPVLLYDGTQKGNQSAHVAVFKLPIENADLQQCADSIIRVYAEYYYHRGEYDKISFQFVNGFKCNFSKWIQGYRVKFDNNKTSWVKSASYDDSYTCFKKYMRIVFAYASTLSMEEESYPIVVSDIEVGDIFIKAGSPGHVVMVVDVSKNSDGKKAFLLAQGYMPAQQFHVIKNPIHDDPWYYEDEVTYPFSTAQYSFDEGSLRRLKY